MLHPLTRVLALLSAVVLMLLAGRAVLAQGDKPGGPESPSASITLPASGSTNTSGTAFSITNAGTGRAGYFQVTNTKSVTAALEARTYSTATNAIALSAGVMNSRAGAGSAAIVATDFGSVGTYAIIGSARGSGTAIYGYAQGGNGRGVYGSSRATSGTGYGVYGETLSASGSGVYGLNRNSSGSYGVYGEALSPNGHGVHGVNLNGGSGVYGLGPVGVYGRGSDVGGNGVYGQGAVGVYGKGVDNGNGVEGHGGSGLYGDGISNGVWARGGQYGVYGEGPVGVFGKGADNSNGVEGHGNVGVYGEGSTLGVKGSGKVRGVYGDGPVGVYGKGADNGNGVEGHGGSGLYGDGISNGVWARGGAYGIDASGGTYAGVFRQSINVNGHLYSRASIVDINDPRDDTKLIQQVAVVSPDQLGMINGNVVLDSSGRATVQLPAWFSSIYGDYRYVLTPIGDSADLFIASEAKEGSFVIAGGKAGLKVSWMVSGARQDAAAKADPLKVEVDRADVEPKSPAEPAPADSDK